MRGIAGGERSPVLAGSAVSLIAGIATFVATLFILAYRGGVVTG